MTSEENIKHWAEKAEVSIEESRAYFEKLKGAEEEEEDLLRKIFSRVELPVLELGAGKGEFTREILDKYAGPETKVYAVERLKPVADQLSKNIDDPRLEVFASDSTNLPLDDDSVGLVITRVALHDYVSEEGDVTDALKDSIRVLAPGGMFLVYDKITDGYEDCEKETAEGRMECINKEIAAIEGKKCWGLHPSEDYVNLFEELGLKNVDWRIFETPAAPGYATAIQKLLEEVRPIYVERWGKKMNRLVDELLEDVKSMPPGNLNMMLIWGEK